MSVESILTASRRSADEGLFGYIPALGPGFGSASYYGNEIPLPVNILPFCLTGFVYREATWDPGLTLDNLKGRIRNRYFSSDAPPRLVDDMLNLQQFSLDHFRVINQFSNPSFNYSGQAVTRLTIAGERERVRAISDPQQRRVETEQLQKTLTNLAGLQKDLDDMQNVEQFIKQTEGHATPKTAEGLALLQRMIDDTRRLYHEAVPDPEQLTAPIE